MPYQAIGHLIFEPFVLLMEQKVHSQKKHTILIPPPPYIFATENTNRSGIANSYVLSLWRQHFAVIDNYYLVCILAPLLYHPKLVKFLDHYLTPHHPAGLPRYGSASELYNKYMKGISKKSVLEIPPKDLEKGYSILKKLGVEKGEKFICFFQRDNAYYTLEPQKIRTGSIATLEMGLAEAIKRGYWCIRLSAKCDPLPENLKNYSKIIDYPHTKFRSDFMDVFLISECSLFIGANSGLNFLPVMFDTPSALVNVSPFGWRNFRPIDRSIFKLLKNVKTGQLCDFRYCMHSAQVQRNNDMYATSMGIEWINNSPEEIRDFMVEMLDNVEESAEDLQLQNAFKALDHKLHLQYNYQGRIGISYLRKYKDLLLEGNPIPLHREDELNV
ncbi:MAG: hypothetical protein S4CHLAM81_02530 [Chlamydiales bacterium]|nr:hypothetical protein [Chlamydiales bacterium]MCH9635045.1 hypothetical protein [Chlamydiales bacterium]